MINVLFALPLLVALGQRVSAQGPQSFAGTWQLLLPVEKAQPGPRPHGGTRAKGQLIITQDAAQITLTGGQVSETFSLDGATTTNATLLGADRVNTIARARWKGPTLVLTTEIETKSGKRLDTRTLNIDSAGRLKIEEAITGRPNTPRVQSVYTKVRESAG